MIPLILLIYDAPGKQFLTLFTVIPFRLLILGVSWEAYFDAIYGDPAHFADLRARLGSSFDAIYGDPVPSAHLRTHLGSRFRRYLR